MRSSGPKRVDRAATVEHGADVGDGMGDGMAGACKSQKSETATCADTVSSLTGPPHVGNVIMATVDLTKRIAELARLTAAKELHGTPVAACALAS